MTRDNALYAVIGVLVGFIAAYTVFETLGARQPALRPPGQQTAAGSPGAAAPASQGAPAQQGAPAMEQVQRLRQYVEDNPDDADAVRALGNMNLQVRNIPRALELYDRYVALRPEDSEMMLRVGNLHFDTQSYDRAKEIFETYLRDHPQDTDVLTDLGVAYRSLGQHEEALQRFRQALNARPDAWVALYNEVLVLTVDLERYEEAQEALGRLQALQPGNEDVQRLADELGRRRAAG